MNWPLPIAARACTAALVYSFIAGAGLDSLGRQRGSSVRAMLEDAAAAVAEQLSVLGAPLAIRQLELPELNGGWVTLRPREPGLLDLVSECADAEHACLVFGELHQRGAAADAVRDAWVRGGAAALEDLPGVFSALIVERLQSRLHVFTSLPGCRSLHYSTRGPELIVAPLDLGLVALSRRELEFDLSGVGALVSRGWPLGGVGALVGVRETQPNERLTWSSAGLTMTPAAPLSSSARVAATDRARIASKRDEVAEELRSGFARQLLEFYPAPQKLHVPLTAGVDSRAVLALARSLVEPERIETYTRGAFSQDVRVARQLSQALGIVHEARPLQEPSPEAFASNARFLAIATNAVANSDAAFGPALRVAREPPVPLGAGGEIFRGFYYNYLRRQRVQSPESVAAALLRSPLSTVRSTPFADASINLALERRVVASFEQLARLSSDPFDLTDLFYIFERVGRWSATIWQRALGPNFMPLVNGRAMRALLELPSPVGDHAVLPHLIARHGSRRVYLAPVNGAELLYLEGPGRARHALRETLRFSARLLRKARQRFQLEERSPRQLRLSELQNTLHGFVREQLSSPRSLARALFTSAELARLTDGRHTPEKSVVVGALLSVELYREALEKARARVGRDPAATPTLAAPRPA
jgi:hypothetical protein